MMNYYKLLRVEIKKEVDVVKGNENMLQKNIYVVYKYALSLISWMRLIFG